MAIDRSRPLTLGQLNRATLARQMLLTREGVSPLRAIERLVGMQAQWPRPPFLGLWGRVEGFRRDDLTKLLVERKAVRATFLRGTLHVASARDFVALRPTVQPVLDAGMRAILKALGARVDPERLTRRAREILAEGPQTFEEVRERLGVRSALHPARVGHENERDRRLLDEVLRPG